MDNNDNGLELVQLSEGLVLQGGGLSYKGDFEEMLRRITNGRIHHELLIKAAKTKTSNPIAIDATAGMGEDSLLLAAYGYEVTMFEQNPVIVALLKDAMDRAKRHPLLCEIVNRMHLMEGNSIELINVAELNPNLIYLDPMFPLRKKSGLIGKKLQLIQKLESPCPDEESLFFAAKGKNPDKIIVKRPLKGGFLAGVKPTYSLKGKAIRFDCYSF